MRRVFVALPFILAAVAWWLTTPQPLGVSVIPDHTPDPVAGEQIFWAGGCASCHASPVKGKRARGDSKFRLGGGEELDTPFGLFRVPNISPHPDDGIGSWSALEFVNAMQRGISPDGSHYYPSFPYASYVRMPVEDLIDLKAYIDTLPVIEGQVGDHELQFPWSIRRAIGFWKRLYLDASPVIDTSEANELVQRGQALVEGAGHCGECHTPRTSLGGMDHSRWLAGASSPEGKGRVPDVTPGGKNTGAWSESDIAYYLQSGFTPDFDTVGGAMVPVQENMGKLSDDDRNAMAAYLKFVPASE
ncbi:MAG: cytochrome c [Woeseiaceae bacterium]|nr:cytochrome c [Woeseiaceae bacterium]